MWSKLTLVQASSTIFCTSILYRFHSDVVALSHSHFTPLPAVVFGLYIFRRTLTKGKSSRTKILKIPQKNTLISQLHLSELEYLRKKIGKITNIYRHFLLIHCIAPSFEYSQNIDRNLDRHRPTALASIFWRMLVRAIVKRMVYMATNLHCYDGTIHIPIRQPHDPFYSFYLGFVFTFCCCFVSRWECSWLCNCDYSGTTQETFIHNSCWLTIGYIVPISITFTFVTSSNANNTMIEYTIYSKKKPKNIVYLYCMFDLFTRLLYRRVKGHWIIYVVNVRLMLLAHTFHSNWFDFT